MLVMLIMQQSPFEIMSLRASLASPTIVTDRLVVALVVVVVVVVVVIVSFGAILYLILACSVILDAVAVWAAVAVVVVLAVLSVVEVVIVVLDDVITEYTTAS